MQGRHRHSCLTSSLITLKNISLVPIFQILSRHPQNSQRQVRHLRYGNPGVTPPAKTGPESGPDEAGPNQTRRIRPFLSRVTSGTPPPVPHYSHISHFTSHSSAFHISSLQVSHFTSDSTSDFHFAASVAFSKVERASQIYLIPV